MTGIPSASSFSRCFQGVVSTPSINQSMGIWDIYDSYCCWNLKHSVLFLNTHLAWSDVSNTIPYHPHPSTMVFRKLRVDLGYPEKKSMARWIIGKIWRVWEIIYQMAGLPCGTKRPSGFMGEREIRTYSWENAIDTYYIYPSFFSLIGGLFFEKRAWCQERD